MNKTNIKSPRYHSDQLYKFGMDKQANQNNNVKSVSPNSHLTPSKLEMSAPTLSVVKHLTDTINTHINLASSELVSGSL